MGVEPGGAGADVDLERDGERHRVLHRVLDERGDLGDLALRAVEDEFVVDLQHEARAKAALAQLGQMRATVRLPLAEASDATKELMQKVLQDLWK